MAVATRCTCKILQSGSMLRLARLQCCKASQLQWQDLHIFADHAAGAPEPSPSSLALDNWSESAVLWRRFCAQTDRVLF